MERISPPTLTEIASNKPQQFLHDNISKFKYLLIQNGKSLSFKYGNVFTSTFSWYITYLQQQILQQMLFQLPSQLCHLRAQDIDLIILPKVEDCLKN